ncbi:hypothetical protein DYB32_007558 [Aphanomyces invadans]|uniref:Uncharacterized protein n=1 Tax=Aphanomyces invadans TaxID=157072 RepID=A0A418ANM9_9STRA|nr:hypothetical protein DYB32_007558 [Aphanomyces invadans]
MCVHESIVSQKVQSHKSFRKDYLAYCKVLNVTPHPKLCPRLDEEDKDLLGGAAIAEALKTNTKLAVLNLFRNDLADDGAAALAYALPDNKTLMHLSVTILLPRAMSLIRAITRYVLREDQLQHAADVEVQIQAAVSANIRACMELKNDSQLDAAKKQKKKLERADVIKELNLPDTETIDGVMYGVGNATLQSLTISGNNLTSYDDLQPLNKLLEDHHAKLKTHLHVVKAQRMFPRNASSPKPLSEFLLL